MSAKKNKARRARKKLARVEKLVKTAAFAGVDPEVIKRILLGDVTPTPTPFTIGFLMGEEK